MSREYVTSIDLRGNRLLDAVLTLENIASINAPYPVAGRIIHDNGVVKYHDGIDWKALGTGGGSTGDVSSTRMLTAGAGLTGGGDLSANRTFDVGAGVGILVTADNVGVNTATIQARSERGTANGYVPLDGSGLIPTMYLPPLAVNNVFSVPSQAAMLALTAQTGDMAVRTDNGKTYVLAAEPAAVLGNWVEVMATGQVVSVNGQTGVVSITAASLGAAGTATQVIAGAGLVGGGSLTGNITLDVAGDGNLVIQANQIQVVSAPKWTTPRTITLTGDASGTVTLDGSANVTMTTVVTGGSGGGGGDGLTEAQIDALFLKPSEILAGSNITITESAGAVTISGEQGVNVRGAWSPVVTYYPNDVVTSGGSSWIAMSTSTGMDPSADSSNNPVGSFTAPSPLALGSPTAIATGFTVDRGTNVVALNVQPSWGTAVPSGVVAGIASAINVPGVGIQWLGQGTPLPSGKVMLDQTLNLSVGVRYWFVLLNATGVMIDQGPEIVGSHLTWTGEFFYGSTEPTNNFGTYASPFVMFGTSDAYPWQLFVGKGDAGLTEAQIDALFLKPSEILAGSNITVTESAGAVTISSDHTHPDTVSFQWTYDSNGTMVDPGLGNVRTDTAAGVPSTQIAFSDITEYGVDASHTLAALAVGDLIVFQETVNAANWGRYEITEAPTDNGTWWLMPVTVLELHGSAIAKNQDVLVRFTYGTSGGGGVSVPTRYVHNQAILASTWTVNHNLGAHPAVAVEDAVGTVIYGTIQYLNDNALTVTFTRTVTGRASCI